MKFSIFWILGIIFSTAVVVFILYKYTATYAGFDPAILHPASIGGGIGDLYNIDPSIISPVAISTISTTTVSASSALEPESGFTSGFDIF